MWLCYISGGYIGSLQLTESADFRKISGPRIAWNLMLKFTETWKNATSFSIL